MPTCSHLHLAAAWAVVLGAACPQPARSHDGHDHAQAAVPTMREEAR